VSAPSAPPQQTSMASRCNSSGSQQGTSIRLPGVLTTREPLVLSALTPWHVPAVRTHSVLLPTGRS
jgi:hypothetical protein